MENKEYYVELAYAKKGTYYEVNPLTPKKMLEYCSDLAEINPELIDEIDLSGKTAVQWLYNKNLDNSYARNIPGSIYIAYATSEEEALYKVLNYDAKADEYGK